MIFSKTFSLIDWSDVDLLISNDQEETEHLDYKKDMPGRTDSDRKELAADVSSFANSSGGFIIYGIEEKIENGQKTGRPYKVNSVLNTATATDIQRLEQIITTGITPRVPDVQIKTVKDPNSTDIVVIVKISQSWAGPHMVSLDQQNKFHIRKQNGKFPMDYLQIRDGFLQSSIIQNKIKHFCDLREQALLDHSTPLAITDHQSLMLHIVPISTFSRSVSTAKQLKDDQFALRPIFSSSMSEKVNIDGLVRLHAQNIQSYAQVFWDLTHEFADSLCVTPFGNNKEIFSVTIGRAVCRSVKRAFDNMARLGVGGPKAIILRLNGVQGIPLSNGGDPYFNNDHPFDRNRVLIPDILEDGNDHLKVTAQIMEKVANAAGFETSANVVSGSWTGGEDER